MPANDKPKKPRPDFPLTANGNGQWSKKIGGKVRYFGIWADHDAALEKFKKDFPYLNLGLEPPAESTTLADVLNAFNDDKKALLDAGKIAQRTYNEYIAVCDVVAETLGRSRPFETITALDLKKLNHVLAIGKGGQPVSPVTHKRLLTFARMIFCFATEILDLRIKYKKPLRPPEKKLLRERRAAAGERMFSAPEIRALLEKADPNMKAVIYLGINCGFGPADCVEFPRDKIVDGFHNFGRKKTGVERRCPLWPETLAAIAAIGDDVHVLNGRKWDRHLIARQLKALCEDCGVYRAGITTPYSLRRTFETIAKNSDVNQSVIDKIMGHERPEMSEVYNQRTFDSQLVRCTDFVRGWVLGSITI